MTLTIKDLSLELDAKALTAVHGGGDLTQGIYQGNTSGSVNMLTAQSGVANSAVGVVAPNQGNYASNTGFNSEFNLHQFDLDITKVAVGGIVL